MINKKVLPLLTFLFLLFVPTACESETIMEVYSTVKNVEDIENITLNTEIPNITSSNHAFIVLGFALSEDGEMQDTLLERLRIAKRAGEINEDSMIIVSGGVPKNGKTEADVMYDWLREQGIDENRIIKEDQSRDTVENALNSMKIVEEENIESVTLITSASHIRRALMLFLEVDNGNRISSHIVSMDYEDESNSFLEGEKELIESDLNRIKELLSD